MKLLTHRLHRSVTHNRTKQFYRILQPLYATCTATYYMFSLLFYSRVDFYPHRAAPPIIFFLYYSSPEVTIIRNLPRHLLYVFCTFLWRATYYAFHLLFFSRGDPHPQAAAPPIWVRPVPPLPSIFPAVPDLLLTSPSHSHTASATHRMGRPLYVPGKVIKICSSAYCFIYLFIHSFTINLLIYIFIHSFIYLYLFIYLSIYSFIYLFIYLFIHYIYLHVSIHLSIYTFLFIY